MNTSYITVTPAQVFEKLAKALARVQGVLSKNDRERPREKAAEQRLRDLTQLLMFATVENRILLSLEDVLLIEGNQ